MARARIALTVVSLMVAACSSSQEASRVVPVAPIASIPLADVGSAPIAWRSKCSSCHEAVEPGSRSRVAVEAAMTRHRKRVRLTSSEWAQMVDFLAPPDATSRAQGSSTSPM